MAPTKANATYAVTTHSLRRKGPTKVIEGSSLVHVAAARDFRLARRRKAKKSALLTLRPLAAAAGMVKEA
jgi:hypothetical protein